MTLPGLGELVRSYRTPEFAGLTFHEVRSKSVLNKVPGESAMPFRWTVNPYRGCSHSCVYCCWGGTPILMADGRTKPIERLRIGDEIYGTVRKGNDRHYVRTRVLAHWSTVKPAYRILLEDGTELIASGDHRFLSERGWKYVTGTTGVPRRPCLVTGNKLMGTGGFVAGPQDTGDYRRGYLCGLTGGDADLTRDRLDRELDREALDRGREYLVSLGGEMPEWPTGWPSDDWAKGFLAGIFDAEGSCSGGSWRIGHTDPEIIDITARLLKEFGFEYVIEDLGRVNGIQVVRLTGGLTERLRFFHLTDPAITRKRDMAGAAVTSDARFGVVQVEPLGLELPMFDITTGTGDFIANGVISHNCFARNSHKYLDFDAGHDFDSQVIVKVNAPEVLATQLRSPRWTREHVAMGTNTDPYQRAEGRYELLPRIIGALARSGTPFSILTKGTLLSRDLPLLASAARDVSVGLGVSIAMLDRELHREVEPGTPSPQARLELVRRVRAAGLPCGVFVAPVLPGLTDSVAQLDRLLAAIADAGATGVTVLALHLRPGTREWFAAWLRREHPELIDYYRMLYGRGSYVDRGYRRLLANRVGPLLRRHGLAPKQDADRRGIDEAAEVPEPRGDDEARGEGETRARWPKGSLPAGSDPNGTVDQEQLTLL